MKKITTIISLRANIQVAIPISMRRRGVLFEATAMSTSQNMRAKKLLRRLERSLFFAIYARITSQLMQS